MGTIAREICYIDLDDTMCNFMKAYRLALYREPHIQYPQSQLKFFENLEPINGAIDAYWKLSGKYHVRILTRPSVWNPLSYMEKRLWVEKHLGFKECDNLIMSCDKTLLRGLYLIDDAHQEGLLVPEWKQLVFGSLEFPDWNSICNFLLK